MASKEGFYCMILVRTRIELAGKCFHYALECVSAMVTTFDTQPFHGCSLGSSTVITSIFPSEEDIYCTIHAYFAF